jgi:hypothetical protein
MIILSKANCTLSFECDGKWEISVKGEKVTVKKINCSDAEPENPE